MVFGISYAEWIGYIVVVVLVFAFGLPNGWLKRLEKYYSSDHLHQPVAPEDVRDIILQTGSGVEKALNGEEGREVVALFNGAKLVEKTRVANETDGARLRIVCKDGRTIEIVPYRHDVIVHLSGGKKNHSPIEYWAKQDTLSEWLRRSGGELN